MQGKNLSDNFNYPLLSMQEAFVSHIIRKKDSQEYLIKIIFEISPCDPQKVFEAWQQIHDIYEVFKLKFNIHDNGELSQAFTSKNPHQVKFLDATKYSEERLKNLTDNLLSDFAINNNGKQITNFSQSIIVKISNDKSLLVWVLHHVLIDGWSMMRLLKKFKECYSNENLQYKPDNSLSTYLTWKQHNHYKSRSYDFWKTELSVFEAPSYLNERDFDKNEEEPCNYLFEINGILLENIKASARRLHTTINIILQSAWIILLQNISGKDTVAYGVVVNGRDYNYEECNEVVGLLINTLPCIVKINDETNSTEFIKQVHKKIFALQEHFDLALSALHAIARTNFTLFDHIFVFENLPSHADDKSDLNIKRIYYKSSIDYKLAIIVNPNKFSINFRFSYKSSSITNKEIKNIYENYISILEGLIKGLEKDIKMSNLEFTQNNQGFKLIPELNDFNKYYSFNESMLDIFFQQAAKCPNKIAIKSVHENINLTYNDLANLVNLFRDNLTVKGLVKGDFIGLNIYRSVDLVALILASVSLGLIYVALDPNYPKGYIDYVIEDSSLKFIITESNSTISNNNILKVFTVKGLKNNTVPRSINPVNTNYSDPIFLLYTSGSTGRPKGVLGSQLPFLNRNYWLRENYPFDANEVYCIKTSINFIDSVWDIFLPLMNGLSLVLFPEDILNDIPKFVKYLKLYQISRLSVLPSLLIEIINFCGNLKENIPYLTFYDLTGEHLTKVEADIIRKNIFSSDSSATIINRYGTTEVPSALCKEITEFTQYSDLNSLGKPIQNVQAYILDKHGRPILKGCYGELCIGGICVAHGYYNRPELTKIKFTRDFLKIRLGHDDLKNKVAMLRLYRTGDFCKYNEEGEIEYFGRSDNQSSINGYRIELGEIESRVKELESVKDAAVIIRNKALICFYTSKASEENEKILSNQIDTEIKLKLPKFMIPNYYHKLEKMPFTSNGKLDKKSLPEISIQSSFKSPESITEHIIKEIWEKTLGISPLSTNSKFYYLGGHSILLLKLLIQLQERLNVTIDFALFNVEQTIQDMADIIFSNKKIEFPNIISFNSNTSKTQIFCIHPSSGFSMIYSYLSRAMNVEFFGINNPLLEKRDNYSSIEKMAQGYIADILKLANQKGRLIVGGWSFGGAVAYEAAFELLSCNKTKPLVILIDSFVMHLKDSHIDDKATRRVADYYNISPESEVGKLITKQMESNWLLSQKYIPKASDLDVILFQATKDTKSQERNNLQQLNGWLNTALNIKVFQIHCDHFEIIKPPFIYEVTKILKTIIGENQ